MKFKGKFYENNAISYLSVLLYNLRWVGVFLIAINALPVLERATSSYGLDDETVFWGWLLVIGTVCLFIFKKRWENLCDKITDYLAEYLAKRKK